MFRSARTNPNKSGAVLFHKPHQNRRFSALQTKASEQPHLLLTEQLFVEQN